MSIELCSAPFRAPTVLFSLSVSIMSRAPSALFLCLLALASYGAAGITPLASKHFPRPTDLPYQVDTDHQDRGSQSGYNQCNSTTEGPSSLCQTSYVNDLSGTCHIQTASVYSSHHSSDQTSACGVRQIPTQLSVMLRERSLRGARRLGMELGSCLRARFRVFSCSSRPIMLC